MTVPFTVLIPARLASTRLPNKPLAALGDAPMVVRVAQRALQSAASRTVVACDSLAIADACAAHGVESVLTRDDHVSGSDRLAEACALLGLDDGALVVNVQGDEPLIAPQLIDAVAELLRTHPQAAMSTAAHAIASVADFVNPNVVKVTTDCHGLALSFSRAPMPWWRDGFADGVSSLPTDPAPLRHVGIYGYRVGFLRTFPTLSQAPIERCESLEQMRALWHGHRIAVHTSDEAPGPGVDTPEDLARMQAIWARQGSDRPGL